MNVDRYHRQALLSAIGPEGQARLGRARVIVVGCGALGCHIADHLVRAGVGTVGIVDRDLVELTNLQRQTLFDEEDARGQTPKAVAAASRLARVNASVRVEPVVADVHAGNVERLAGLEPGGQRCDVILDGTDNAETRYLLNDVSVKHGVPWVYGACVGTEGRCMAMRPPATPCLRCLYPRPPAPGELPTCDTAGVLGPAAAAVAALQATAAIRLLIGADGPAELVTVDVWRNHFRSVDISTAKRADCPACGRGTFEFLDASPAGTRSVSLCGRDAVQVRPAGQAELSLGGVGQTLARLGRVERTPHLLRFEPFEIPGTRLTIFPDARAIIHGVTDPDRARTLYARFIGH